MSKVALLIHGKRFVFWSNISISQNIDAVSAINFEAPFDHTAPDFKENFEPFGYAPMVVTVDDVPLFTGTMLNVDPEIGETRRVKVNGYATCGVLMDCTAPADALPLEFNNLTLKEIAEKLASYFKIGVKFQGDPGAKFSRVACDPDKKIFEFLTDLAKQRGFVISSDVMGDLMFWKSAEGEPVAILDQGLSPLLSVKTTFNPQEYYSDLTGLSPVKVGKPAAKRTTGPRKKRDPESAQPAPAAKKPKPAKKYSKFSVQDEAEVFRPLNFKIEDIDGADVETATQAKLARMLGNMASYTIDVATWHDSAGNLWAPNTKIKLRAPDAMIYDFYTFEIRSVDFKQTDTEETATIGLSLPGSFSGEPPEIFPWEL